jgi:hypothetical protein
VFEIDFTVFAPEWINNAFNYSTDYFIHSAKFIVLKERTFFAHLV